LSPKATDTVTVNYRGSLISGQEFDSGENVSFPLNGVIRGWTEGLQLMKEGAKYRFFIPPELAYGERGAGRVIPPNAALIFDVELVKVNP
ncbi:MAG: FKBP-type peptidyl-prolyl cis-trans isomerase, partial [Methylocaldum sp.]|nr:FKBP-type peptidyl-prolyl cis-trans isomerase [Methylocaldum sp.]